MNATEETIQVGSANAVQRSPSDYEVWKKANLEKYPDADWEFAETVWNAAQETMLRPLMAAGDEEVDSK